MVGFPVILENEEGQLSLPQIIPQERPLIYVAAMKPDEESKGLNVFAPMKRYRLTFTAQEECLPCGDLLCRIYRQTAIDELP